MTRTDWAVTFALMAGVYWMVSTCEDPEAIATAWLTGLVLAGEIRRERLK